MCTKAIMTGLWGLLVLVSPAVADPPLAATEKAYRLLQTVASQLQEAQTTIAPGGSTSAAALMKAHEHVRIAVSHVCHALYVAQLTAAKTALTQGDRQQALRCLRKARETLSRCPALPDAEPRHDQEESHLKDAVARQ
ncbi:MAG TPA: hypothetical protein VNN62_26230 [Methylomirabilota bacterium]|jgi:hypothetical protein|nr:hypothetical protein [Methylomirabilota bacterium]